MMEPDGGCACIFKRHPGRACSGTVAPQCQYSPERQGSAAVARREPDISHPVQTLARTQGSRLDQEDRKSTRLNSSHYCASRMPSSARNKKQESEQCEIKTTRSGAG